MKEQTVTDRELLEAAAKAAGMGRVKESAFRLGMYVVQTHENDWTHWNPLADDGDALRLLVTVSRKGAGLRLMLPEVNDAWAVVDDYTAEFKVREFNESDPYAATRRAIVRAAAAMAKEST